MKQIFMEGARLCHFAETLDYQTATFDISYLTYPFKQFRKSIVKSFNSDSYEYRFSPDGKFVMFRFYN